MRKNKKPVVLQDVLVEDYAAEGKSLARVEGKVVFVENTVPGDVVDLQLLKNKKDWAEGRTLQFKQYSADRVAPFCRHFGVCGGCQWQMLPYDKQLLYKQKQVQDNLQRIGKLPLPDMLPIAGCDETRHYRNKLEYTFSTKRFIPRDEFIALQQGNGAQAAEMAMLGTVPNVSVSSAPIFYRYIFRAKIYSNRF